MKDLHLYIGNREVEFHSNPEILYTYQTDELNNPTIVKNSFSKTITIYGSSANNQLFGHFWNVERLQVNGGDRSGVYFNASKKMPFALYIGNEIYEQGYVKLDEVRRVDGNYEYDITLFGGLGDFFYNLSINDDGNEMKLSDLTFGENIDFTININTVKEAWSALENGTNGKWQTINFMPAYNGLPDDFDSNKIIINTKGTNLAKTKAEGGKNYKTKNDYVLGTLPDEMTEWETRDLRSYLQRPCIRMKEVVKACCDPVNNGGYEVVLDSDFFNENNPYWEKTWMTLPMIQALEYDSGEQALEGAKLIASDTTGDTEKYMYQDLKFDMGEYPNSIPSSISLKATIDVNLKYENTSYIWFWNWNGDSYHSGWWCVGSLFCQLLAFNGDKVVGASQVYNLTTPIRHNGKLYYGDNADYDGGHKYTPYMGKPINNILGTFKSNGFTRENASTPAVLHFVISGLTTNVTSVKMCYYWGASKDKIKKAGRAFYLFDRTYSNGWVSQAYNSHYSTNPADANMVVKTSNLKAVLGGTIGRTGTEVTKSLILNTEASPADYLLSYCKMFGLYFTKDVYENKIYIETRKSFYNRDEVINLEELVDYSKGINISPIAFDTKWVQFSQEKDETQFSSNYLTTKGIDYGCKVLNTGYEFNSEKKELLEENVIKSGIEGLERSKYFVAYNNDDKVRPWFGYGLKYNLYNGEDTIEVNGTNAAGSNIMGINEGEGMKYYDLFPKLQFHDADNSPTDGNNCLVFFSGVKDLSIGRANPINYYLTDDCYWQSELNEGTPCWLFTTSDTDVYEKPAARKINTIPVFERYLTDSGGNRVKKSLDFGSPQELFIPSYSITDEVNIYNNFWKTYLEDLYDINTRVLTAWVRIVGQPNPNWLRKFYWFENAIWRINKITDWNVGSYDTTKVEFVKVQNVGDYTSITQTKSNTIKLTASKYNVNPNGERVTLDLTTLNEGSWFIKGSDNGLIFSKTNGTGSQQLSVTIPQTKTPATNTPYYITAVDDEGNMSNITINQGYNGETQLTVKPNNLIVPSSGGFYDIDFEWINQGNNKIENYSLSGDINAEVVIDGFDGDLTVKQNIENNNISGKVRFYNSNFDAEIGIDQLVERVNFTKDGGSVDMIFNYNSNLTFLNLPYWLSVSKVSDMEYRLTAIPNYYEDARQGTITVSNGANTADFRAFQEVGEAPAQDTPKVSPTSLYFNAEGGTQYLSISIPNTWVITENLDWISLNMNNGNGTSIVSVTAATNEGNTRSGIIKVRDVVSGIEYDVYVTQIGTTSTRSFTINPTTIDAPADGGTYTVTINYENRNGDYVGVSGDGVSWTDLNWLGDVATTTVTVPNNATHSGKVFNITFTSSIGNVILTINQVGLEETLTLDKTMIGSDMNGDSNIVSVDSNVPWYTETSVDWITVNPSSGEGKMDVSIITDKNPTVEDRTGYVYFKSVETNAILGTIKVTQGKLVEVISINPSSIVFDAEGGTATFTINSNTSWNILLME